jgi:hypothetical protein
MTGYTVEFNVFQPSFDNGRFSPGHMNVTLRRPDGKGYTFGANQNRFDLGLTQ